MSLTGGRAKGGTVMGWVAVAAAVAFGLAIAMLATFFATRDERFDRVAEWTFVLFAVLAVPMIAAVAASVPGNGVAAWGSAAIGIAGAAVVGLGELGLGVHVLDFRRIAPVMTLGFVAFLLWIGTTSILLIAGGADAVALGWLGLASIGVGLAIVAWITRVPGVMRGDREPGRAAMLAFFVPMAGIVAWLALLGPGLGL